MERHDVGFTPRALGAVSVAFGLLVLGWWRVDAVGLLGAVGGALATRPTAALGVVTLGVALLVGARRVSARSTAALLATLLGLATLAEHLAGLDGHLDRLLAGPALPGDALHMTSAAALGLALLGAAILAAPWRHAQRVLEACCGLVGAGAFAWLLLYLYSTGVNGLPPHARMPALTSALLLIQAMGVLLLLPGGRVLEVLSSPDLGGLLARRLLPAAILVPTVLGALRLLAEQHGLLATGVGVGAMAVSSVLALTGLVGYSAVRVYREEPPDAREVAAPPFLSDSECAAIVAELRAVQAITDVTLAPLGTAELLRELVGRLRSVLSCDAGILAETGDAGRSLRVVASSGLEEVGCPDAGCPECLDFATRVAEGRRALSRMTEPRAVERLRSRLGVPLLVEERLIGVAVVACVTPRAFSTADVRLMELLASRAAAAIERNRLQDDLRESGERLHTLSGRLIGSVEAERRRIARELHDDVGQSLTALRMALGRLTPDTLELDRASLLQAVADVIARLRRISQDLRPPILDDLGIVAALEWHAERFGEQTGVRVQMVRVGAAGRLAPDVETAVFRIVQEALTNVARHAGVSEATVRLSVSEREVSAVVEDSGCGFDPLARRPPSSGLSGMTERARVLGGQLEVESAPGRGTRIRMAVPLAPAGGDA